tara:strand:+ start:281 stop:559 length:279 start_codon:yes stop_codon:yes gene_type:complete
MTSTDDFNSNMLGYYHPKNGGKMQIKSKIWFDQSSEWYKNDLMLSGIQRIKNYFVVYEIPDNPDGKYKLCGLMRGCLYLDGKAEIVSKWSKN